MKISIERSGRTLILNNINNFDIDQTFNCGQSFRTVCTGHRTYTNVVGENVFLFFQKGSSLHISNASRTDFSFWENYFDLSADYSAIKEFYKYDSILSDAISFGSGIRILRQDPYEMVITFILSANNHIPRIKKTVERLSESYGNKICSPFGIRFSFPKPETLAAAHPDDLRKICGVGFRDMRIVETSRLISSGSFSLDSVFKMDTDTAREYLMELPGVGPKVADCILLFGFGKRDVFPVDTWIQKIMRKYYISDDFPSSKIGAYGKHLFGAYSGLAQQYLFYYAREKNLQKNDKSEPEGI